MPKNLTFGDIPIGGLFVTGPADTLFIKVDNDPVLNTVEGGTGIDIAEGSFCWTPANRCVREANKADFTRAAERHDWEKISNRAMVPA